MAKILISFVGTGRRTNKDEAKRIYETASYSLNETILKNYSFVSLALCDVIKPDKVFLIGTTHSMWEEVYLKFSKKNGTKFDEEKWLEIGEVCDANNRHSDLVIPYKQDIERAMGDGSLVSLIKYGIDENEIKENTNIILSLVQHMSQNDELIVDITHAFRSLPIYIMQLLIYLKTISKKNINISHIYYGMYEGKDSNDRPSPIVDLVSVININDWIIGAYAFSNFGNSYKIAELLENENKSVAPILRGFSDVMNLNYLYPMQSETQKLSGIRGKEYKTDIPKLIVEPIIEEYIKRFQVKEEIHRQSFFQLKLAEWQYQHRKYAQAFLTSNDAIISYICEIKNWQWDDYNKRQSAKDLLKTGKDLPDIRMHEWFKKHNYMRNGIAHTAKLAKKEREHGHYGKFIDRDLAPNEIIRSLKEDIEDLKNIIGLI